MIKKVGEKIRSIRENKDLTQANMAEELGMKNSSSYAKIERGENTTLKRLFQIAEVLEVDIKVFFEDIINQVNQPKKNNAFSTKDDLNQMTTTILSEIEKLRNDLSSNKKQPKKLVKGKK